MRLIFHVVAEAEWNAQLNNSHFIPAGFERDNFIHCCTQTQLTGVLHRYYAGRTDLVLLTLDVAKLEFPLRYEEATNKEFFPHVYGGLNRSAILASEKIQ